MRSVMLALALFACTAPRENHRVNIAGIDFQGMAWEVTCATTGKQLDERYARDINLIEVECVYGDPLRFNPYDDTDCEHRYHQSWYLYLDAQRELVRVRDTCP